MVNFEEALKSDQVLNQSETFKNSDQQSQLRIKMAMQNNTKQKDIVRIFT